MLQVISKGKREKFNREHSVKFKREQSYNFILSLTSSLDGIGWATPLPGRLTLGKENQYFLYRRLGGP